MDGKSQHIGFLIRESNILIDRLFAAIYKKYQVEGGTQGRVLRYLYRHQDIDIFQKDLEKKFSVRRSTMSVILNGLEKKSYIHRVSVDSDSRLKKIVLTEKGLKESDMMDVKIYEIERQIRKGMTREDVDALITGLETIISNIKEQIEEEER